MPIAVVSVLMITYKHELYIEQALKSILNQQTSFEVEIIVADDCSPDNTKNVVKKICEDHPKGSTVRYFRHKNNIGFISNYAFCYRECKGEYIAICEGDDYWTDNQKLEKQVNYLKRNPEIIAVGHDCTYVDSNGNPLDLGPRPPAVYRRSATAQELKNGFGIINQTLMFRRVEPQMLFNKGYYSVLNGDRYILSMLGQYGGAHFMDDIGPAVYRVHNVGIWSNLPKLKKIFEHNKLFKVLLNHYSTCNDHNTKRNFIHLLQINRIRMIKEIPKANNIFELIKITRHFIVYSTSLYEFIPELKIVLINILKFIKNSFKNS